MTDRELIELAARAAGLNAEIDASETCYVYETGWQISRTAWSPLASDADAFRLAVRLGIDVVTYPFFEKEKHSVVAERTYEMFKGSKIEFLQDYGDDPLAATRRAITRAAAEIGRGMV
jgi:hypothetical protein